jgi:hypothetical protein
MMMFNVIIRCRKLEIITDERKKVRIFRRKMQSRVIFQITFATKSSKDTTKEWHFLSHKESTEATSKPPMPNSTLLYYGIRQ